jgi:DNA topoisomerase-1
MVNEYIKAAVELDFSAKDFRTWAGSLHALQAFRTIGEGLTATDRKKNLVTALDAVSVKLGNTRTVCKKYYVHPGLIQLYEENKLMTYLNELDSREKEGLPADEDINALTAEEQVLMKILKKYIMTPRAAS